MKAMKAFCKDESKNESNENILRGQKPLRDALAHAAKRQTCGISVHRRFGIPVARAVQYNPTYRLFKQRHMEKGSIPS